MLKLTTPLSVISACLVMAFCTFPTSHGSAQQAPDCGIYTYRAKITRVIDGDTVVADIDLGFDTWLHNEHLRLSRIDAPENRTPEGATLTAELKASLEGRTLYICTQRMKRKDREAEGSLGRYLVEIYVDGESVNQWQLDTGRAEAWEP